jgi:hypothetical protein
VSKLKKGELLKWLEEIKTLNYRWWDKKDEQVYRQIRELIQKSGVTEKWIEEKARSLQREFRDGSFSVLSFCKFFICSLIEESK